MFDPDHTATAAGRMMRSTGGRRPRPALLVAHCPDGAVVDYKIELTGSVVAGRADERQIIIKDHTVSSCHFVVANINGRYVVADTESKNGTFVNGERLKSERPLEDGDLIRAGNTLIIYCADPAGLSYIDDLGAHGLVGRFHSAKILGDIGECAKSGRHILLAGPTGSGKEVAANAYAALTGRNILAHNAARFSSKEEAATTLFGVGKRIFSNVDERPGFLEQAHGGILFLDEAHCLPKRVQKSLLRFAEDGMIARIGRTEPKKVDVRLILASNEPSPLFGLAKDLVQRLRVVDIPPLSQRRADIPSLFKHMLQKALRKVDVDAPTMDELIEVEHWESMVLDGFESGNVRELMDLADRIATRIDSGAHPYQAVDDIFFERFGKRYEIHDKPREDWNPSVTMEIKAADNFPPDVCKIIEELYSLLGGNVSAMQRELQKRGLPISRRRIAKHLDFMKLKRSKKPKD